MNPVFYQNLKLGVLGGGQLGRMLLQSAPDFNLEVHILDRDADSPCRNLCTTFTQGSLKDFDAVYNFGKDKDLITIEIEAVNTEALSKLESEGVKVLPQPHILRLIQDKRTQKQFYKDNGIPTADFVLTENKAAVAQYADFLPAVHKLGKEGYDGRGVQKIASPADFDKAFDQPGLLEKMIDFEKEISVIIARNENGETAIYPPVELVFHPEHNLVEYLIAPAEIPDSVANEANRIATNVINKLGLIGILAVEMFVTKDGQVLVNEIAPRTHNSGHQSIKGNCTSQFEQHLRAILNLPLGSTAHTIQAAMVNLLGEPGYEGNAIFEGIEKVLAVEGAYVLLYGKKTTKPFRKMGHVTIVDTDRERLKNKVKFVKENLKVIA